MKNAFCVVAVAMFFCRCADSGTNNVVPNRRDTTAVESIDSSAIMNDSTRLPKDTAATGVMH